MMHSHRLSLSEMPELRTCGAFGDDSVSSKWNQPSDMWQLLLMHHSGEFIFNGHTYAIEPFDLFIVPPMSRCQIERWGAKEFVYNFAGFVPQASQQDIVSLAVKTSLGSDGHFWDKEFRTALNNLQFSRTRSKVIVWNLLWSIAQPEHIVVRSVYTEQAERFIEEHLGSRLRLSDLCSELSISASQLTKHFLQDTGRTPHQYILDRKAHLAHRLLTTTTQQVKQVAAACGMPNIQQFNRFVKARYGDSPRNIRRLRGSVDFYRVNDLARARGERHEEH